MRTIILWSILLSGLAACAAWPQWDWQHPQRTAEERDADWKYCRKLAGQSVWGGGFTTSPASFHIYQEEREALQNRCMYDLGYEAVRVDNEQKNL